MEGDSVQRIGVVADLVPGSRERAEELVAKGPPFELSDAGFTRHSIYIATDRVVFIFEGDDVEQHVSAIADDPAGAAALSHWAPILDGTPQIAREAFGWEKPA